MTNLRLTRSAGTLAALAAALLLGGLVAADSIRAQDTGDWKSVTIVYNSDVVGKIDPCG